MAATPFLSTVSGTATSFFPLPTAWSSAGTDCAKAIYAQIGDTFFGWDPWYANNIQHDLTTCWPSEATSWWSQGQSTVSTVLGPEFACPSAYSEVYTSSEASQTIWTICCPSGYSLNFAGFERGSLNSQCTSTVAVGDTLDWWQVFVASSGSAGVSTAWTTTSAEVQSSAITISGIPIDGLNVVSANTVTANTATANTVPSSASTKTGGSISPESGTATSSSSNPTLRVVGVAVGASLGAGFVILLLSLGAFLVWRRRRRSAKGTKEARGGSTFSPKHVHDSGVSAEQGYHVPTGQHVAELNSRQPSTHGPFEMHGLSAERGDGN